MKKLLGSGGFAEVYELWDDDLHRKLAAKVLRPDMAWTSGMLARFKQAFPELPVTAVSALTTQGVDDLVTRMADTLAALPKELPRPSETMKVYRMAPTDEGWTVDVEGDGYRVRGKRVERIVAMTDLTNPDAVEMLQGTLKRMGVLQALEAAGVGSGDTVHFGNVELEWE